MNDVTEASNQIAQQIVTAIQEASAASSMNSIISMFTRGVLGGLGLGNDGSTISDITNLFTTLASIIGQELQISDTQAGVQTYNSDFESWMSDLNQLPNLSSMDIQEQLVNINDKLNEAFTNFQSNPTFTQYAYYTCQPLYINAVLHVNVLSMLALAEQAVGFNDSEYYLYEAVTMQQSYLTLLQNYAAQTGPYRASFITSVDTSEQPSCGGLEGDYGKYTFSFQDNFVGTTVVQEQDDKKDGLCDAAIQQAQSSYVQAVESGTTAYFDQYFTSYSNYNPNQGSAFLLFV